MRKIIYGLLFCLAFVEPVGAYNATDAKQTVGLAGLHFLIGFIPNSDAWFGAKFSAQFGTGVHDPVVAVVALTTQHVYGDKGATSLSSASSMFNRMVALEFAERTNQTIATGYLLAASLDMIAIALTSSEGVLKTFRNDLIEWKVTAALTNAFEQSFLVDGHSPQASALITSAITGGLAMLLKLEDANPKVATALIAETGYRLVPSLVSQDAIKWVLGIPLILLSNRMRPGAMNTFVGATACAFLINTVTDLVGGLKRLVI